MTQHHDNKTNAKNHPQNTEPAHHNNKTKPRPPLNKTHRRTKAEIQTLMRACWQNHINAQHHEIITKQYGISFGYYYKLIRRAAKTMLEQYGQEIDAITMRVIDQYLRNYRLAMQHYAQAVKERDEARQQTDRDEYHKQEGHALNWLGKAKENQDALAQFLMKTNLINAKPDHEINVNVNPFQEALTAVQEGEVQFLPKPKVKAKRKNKQEQ